MSKAEEFAEKAYPVGDTKLSDAAPSMCRNAFIEGYRRAEKDLELTWEDMKLIWNITDEMDNMPEEEFYKEVLKRYKERKEK